jgi:photosystem II stability/assembly factor-like uncharacterized protein
MSRKDISITVTIILFLCLSSVQLMGQWSQIQSLPKLHRPYAMDAIDAQTAIVPDINEEGVPSWTRLYLTTNGGISWREMPGPGEGLRAVFDISMIDTNHIWMVDCSHLYATADCGQTWTVQSTVSGTMFNYIEMFDLDYGVAMADGPSDGAPLIYKTSNGGATWQPTNNPDNDIAQFLSFYNDHIGIYNDFTPTLYRTSDGGQTWDSVAAYGNLMAFDPENPAHVWRTSGEGILASSDTGSTWTVQLYSSKNFWDLKIIDETHGWALTTFAVYRMAGASSGIDKKGETIPQDFTLSQNYPNPFNGGTVIHYSLSRPAEVSLKLCDMRGRRIRI